MSESVSQILECRAAASQLKRQQLQKSISTTLAYFLSQLRISPHTVIKHNPLHKTSAPLNFMLKHYLTKVYSDMEKGVDTRTLSAEIFGLWKIIHLYFQKKTYFLWKCVMKHLIFKKKFSQFISFIPK